METKGNEPIKDLKYYEGLVTKKPQYISWHNGEFADSIHEHPEFVEGISDEDKVLATIAGYNQIDMVATYKCIAKVTGKQKAEIKTILQANKKLVSLIATHDEDTGLLNGCGWVFNGVFYY